MDHARIEKYREAFSRFIDQIAPILKTRGIRFGARSWVGNDERLIANIIVESDQVVNDLRREFQHKFDQAVPGASCRIVTPAGELD